MPVFLNWDFNCLVLPPEGIARMASDAKAAGADGLNIRISNKGAFNFRTKAGTCYTERLDAFGPDYDPLRILIAECRRQKIASCVWFDLFEGAYASVLLEHPEFCPQGLPGKPRLPGVPCYAHREVRKYMLDVVDELAGYRPDYIFFCTKSSHVPANQRKEAYNRDSGFNPPVVERYRELYGIDILQVPFDREKLGRIRSEFLLDFLVDAKQRMNRAGAKVIVGATLSGKLQSTGPNLLLDWKRILDRGAADAISMCNARGECWAFFDPKGQEKFHEIAEACRKSKVEFWPYFIADQNSYNTIIKKHGMDALIDYLPRQMDYFCRLGGDAAIIHDLDLLVSNRDLQFCIWRALDRRSNIPISEQRKRGTPVPEPRSTGGRAASEIPQGDFEDKDLLCWYATPCWRNEPNSAVTYGSFEQKGKDGQPAGWLADTGGNDGLFSVYDWKVLHDEPDSGRSYEGRSSVLLGARSGAGKRENRTAHWTADFPLPTISLGRQIIRVQTHGEKLRGIAKAGMHVELLDRESRVLAELDAAAPTEGTHAWRPLEIVNEFPRNTARMKVSLFLTVDKTAETAGRLWFDNFEIAPAVAPAKNSLVFLRGDGAFEDKAFAELNAFPGIDMTSAPFHASLAKNAKLQLALRADQPMPVMVRWQGEPSREATFKVDDKWRVYSLDLQNTKATKAVSIVIRPLSAGVVSVDAVKVCQ